MQEAGGVTARRARLEIDFAPRRNYAWLHAVVRNTVLEGSYARMTHAQILELGRLRPQLVSFAMLRLRSRDEAEDAVQEALLAALEGIERFSGESSLRTWLTGILKHKIVDRLRAFGREQPLTLEEDDLPVSQQGPEQALARERAFQTLEKSLSRLPANAARVFVMRELWGLEPEDVCRRLAISRANCWVLLHRAKARLSRCPDLCRLAADAI
jgi:RNA polymerase sigma-70 factor (ECF subfamily)